VRRFSIGLLGAGLFFCAAAAYAAGCESPTQPIELKGDDGLLAMEIDSGNWISAVHIERRGSIFGATVTGVGSGTVVCLIKLAAGEYRWDRIDLGADVLLGASNVYLRVPDDPSFRFHVDKGVINYGGDFSLTPSTLRSSYLNVVDRSARVLVQLDTNFPGLRAKYPLRYQGASPDRFLEFAAAELGGTPAQKALEAGSAGTLKEPGKNAGADLRLLVEELFARPQVSRARLNAAGDLVAMIEYRKGSNRLSVYDPRAHVAADVYAGVAAVESIRFADDRTLVYELNQRSEANRVVHIQQRDDAAPTFAQYTIPGRGWFIDTATTADGARATYAHLDNDGAVHMFRIELGGNRMDTRQFASSLRLDKGLQHAWTGLSDAAGVLRVALTRADGDNVLMYRPDAASAWREVRRIGPDERFEPLQLNATGDSLVALSDRDRGQLDLVRVALPSGELRETLFSAAGIDVEGAITHDSDRSVLGVSLYRDGSYETHYLEAPDESVRAAIARALPGKSIALYDTSADRKRMLILASDETTAGTFYLFDTAARALQEIESVQAPMPHVHPVRSRLLKVSAVDGTPLESYLTLPNTDKPPYALIVMPHGGPIGIRDALEFDPEVQLLAQRGYAVLRVNYRGSGGFGRAFEHAGFGGWGKDIEDDILAALDAAAKAAPIDVGRVALRGASYGGYSTLMGLIRSPERFRCGIAASAVSDLPLMFTSSDWSRDPRSRAKMKQIVGDPEKGLKELEAVSPDYLYRKLQRPLLLVHGGSDRRVTPEHALRLLLMLGKAERPPELLFFGAEGHGIVDISARFALEAAGERFLSECLRTDTANAQ
jgi:dipeptidyl aminopeptidase/acylaminoacyl peptidase